MASPSPSCVALIPARSGSKRVPHKNIARLEGHPLIAYTIAAAKASGVFERVVVSTDSQEYADIAQYYGADVPFLRPSDISGSKSPDIEWILFVLERFADAGESYDAYSLLRPTSPCRKPETIRRAWEQFTRQEGVDSLRAVEPCAQHPAKMWVVKGERMHPLMPMAPDGVPPYFSTQYAALPKVYAQNASLEIAWTKTALEKGSLAGEVITPFLTVDDEGLDVNSQYDWRLLEMMVEAGEATLPQIDKAPYPT